jgi:hypothetical protein
VARPDLTDYYVEAAIAGWDTLINDLIDVLAGPSAIGRYADFASLPTAGDYDGCMAVTISPPSAWFSNGTAWQPMAPGMRVATTLLSGLSGATATWANAFPAGVRQIGVSGRVTTLITASGGGATLEVGDHGSADPNRYATGLAFAAGTSFADVATADPGGWNAAARDVVISPDVGAFTAGAVRLYAFYLATFAPTS